MLIIDRDHSTNRLLRYSRIIAVNLHITIHFTVEIAINWDQIFHLLITKKFRFVVFTNESHTKELVIGNTIFVRGNSIYETHWFDWPLKPFHTALFRCLLLLIGKCNVYRIETGSITKWINVFEILQLHLWFTLFKVWNYYVYFLCRSFCSPKTFSGSVLVELMVFVVVSK